MSKGSRKMDFVIVTGISGAGKSTVLKFLEDFGFFCVDNLPPSLLPKFAEICFRAGSEIQRVALGIDIRGGKLFEDFSYGLNELESAGYETKVLFLDASDDVLITRYKETRRTHPLTKGERLETGIERERELLAEVKSRSTYILDTSFILARQLKEKIGEIFISNEGFDNLMITILSFGYKYGIPTDSDLVFDVRFIPNPFYDATLRPMTGNDAPVRDYVMDCEASKAFLDKLKEMLEFLIPHYKKEGKNQLVISIGCTGGKHRSVTLANALFTLLKDKNYSVTCTHRDIEKDAKKG